MCRDLGVERGPNLAVGVQRQGDRAVPEELLHSLGMHAARQEVGRCSVAKIMDPNLWKPSCRERFENRWDLRSGAARRSRSLGACSVVDPAMTSDSDLTATATYDGELRRTMANTSSSRLYSRRTSAYDHERPRTVRTRAVKTPRKTAVLGQIKRTSSGRRGLGSGRIRIRRRSRSPVSLRARPPSRSGTDTRRPASLA
jgi:hypothetical protein